MDWIHPRIGLDWIGSFCVIHFVDWIGLGPMEKNRAIFPLLDEQ